MKKLLLVVFIFSAALSFAQPIRLHLNGGFANYSGDLQEKAFTTNQSHFVAGAGGTFEINDHLAVRSDYSFTHLGADDKKSSNASLRARNLNFQTIIQELTLMGEYNIFSLYTHHFSPYVFAGIGVFHFSPYTFDASGHKVFLAGLSTEGEGIYPQRKVYSKTQFNIPLGGGIRYALSDDIHIGFEIGLRILKTDYLDDVSTQYVDKNTLLFYRGQQAVDLAFRGDELKNNPQAYPAGGTERGNGSVNDYYYYTQFSISFRMPWFDNANGGFKTTRRKLDCPTKL